MADAPALALAVLSGGGLGAVFFGGLWWTVRKAVAARRPALWFAGSLLLRTGLVLAGFLVVSGGRWDRLLACLAGFVAARLVVTHLTRGRADRRAGPAGGACHAP